MDATNIYESIETGLLISSHYMHDGLIMEIFTSKPSNIMTSFASALAVMFNTMPGSKGKNSTHNYNSLTAYRYTIKYSYVPGKGTTRAVLFPTGFTAIMLTLYSSTHRLNSKSTEYCVISIPHSLVSC